jgi:hypothetical protein
MRDVRCSGMSCVWQAYIVSIAAPERKGWARGCHSGQARESIFFVTHKNKTDTANARENREAGMDEPQVLSAQCCQLPTAPFVASMGWSRPRSSAATHVSCKVRVLSGEIITDFEKAAKIGQAAK